MPGADPLIASLKTAVQAAPTDVPLRVHLAVLLEEAGDLDQAVRHAAAALHTAPDDQSARELMARLLTGAEQSPRPSAAPSAVAPHDRMPAALADAARLAARATRGLLASKEAAGGDPALPTTSSAPTAPPSTLAADTRRARRQAMLRAERHADPEPVDAASGVQAGTDTPFVPLSQSAPAADVYPPAPTTPAGDAVDPRDARDPGPDQAPRRDGTGEHPGDGGALGVTFADVGGMADAKERIASTVIAPLGNPTLRRLYARGLAGGVLYYGPPGAGKTLFASAIAGELRAAFVAVDLQDELTREAGLAALEGHVVDRAPVLICLQHVDVLGKSGPTGRDRLLRRVERLLDEAAAASGTDVFVFATTDAPWEVDPSLRRGGRLERAVFVTPPDADARAVILAHSLARLGESVPDLHDVCLLTEGFSGHDLHRLVALADERRRRRAAGAIVGPVLVDDLKASVPHISGSTGAWLETARSQAGLAADDTTYAGLHEYLKASGRW